MAKNQEKKFGLAFDLDVKVICDAPGKKSPIHLWVRVTVGRSNVQISCLNWPKKI